MNWLVEEARKAALGVVPGGISSALKGGPASRRDDSIEESWGPAELISALASGGGTAGARVASAAFDPLQGYASDEIANALRWIAKRYRPTGADAEQHAQNALFPGGR